MQIQASSDLLISQWRFAPKMNTLVQTNIDIVQEDVGDTLTQLERMFNVDTAEGVWLDYLGIRVGIYRPLLRVPANQSRFGWRTVSPPGSPQSPPYSFDQASFKGDIENQNRFPMSDFIFRRLVKARGILVVSRGNFESFVRAVRLIDPDAECVDNRNMTITIATNNQDDIEVADGAGALPRPAGVLIEYETGGTFGFKSDDGTTQSGEGFDRVRYR